MPDDLSQREGEVNDGLRARWVAKGTITNESHGRIKRGGVEARATGTPPTLDTHPFFILSLLFHVTFPPPQPPPPPRNTRNGPLPSSTTPFVQTARR